MIKIKHNLRSIDQSTTSFATAGGAGSVAGAPTCTLDGGIRIIANIGASYSRFTSNIGYCRRTNVAIFDFVYEAIDNVVDLGFVEYAGSNYAQLKRSALNVWTVFSGANNTAFTMVPVAGRRYMLILKVDSVNLTGTIIDTTNGNSETKSCALTAGFATGLVMGYRCNITGDAGATRYVDLRLIKHIMQYSP